MERAQGSPQVQVHEKWMMSAPAITMSQHPRWISPMYCCSLCPAPVSSLCSIEARAAVLLELLFRLAVQLASTAAGSMGTHLAASSVGVARQCKVVAPIELDLRVLKLFYRLDYTTICPMVRLSYLAQSYKTPSIQPCCPDRLCVQCMTGERAASAAIERNIWNLLT